MAVDRVGEVAHQLEVTVLFFGKARDLGPILWISISAEHFLDTFLSSNFEQMCIQNRTDTNLFGYCR
jgi:hypothetical protein